MYQKQKLNTVCTIYNMSMNESSKMKCKNKIIR